MHKPATIRPHEVFLHPFRVSDLTTALVVTGLQAMVAESARGRDSHCRGLPSGSHLVEQTLLAVLSWHLGIDVSPDDLYRNDQGKRFLRSCELEFNVSHAGDWILVAVARSPIGIDIEVNRPLRSARTIANYFDRLYGKTNVLAPGAGVEPGERTLHCWSRAEAVSKCIGVGMTVPLDEFRMPGTFTDDAVMIDTDHGQVWVTSIPSPPHSIAYLAVRHPVTSITFVGDKGIEATLSQGSHRKDRPHNLRVSWARAYISWRPSADELDPVLRHGRFASCAQIVAG